MKNGILRLEVELNRLRLLEGVFDSATIRHLETTRASEGWNCLEVGAVARSVAQWLSTCIGSTGKVVAMDIDLRFLRQKNLTFVE